MEIANSSVVRTSSGELQRSTEDARYDIDGRRIYTCLAYDCSTTDRHGETILASAFGPIGEGGIPILLFHNSESFPVGKVTSWTNTERGPVAEFVLADTSEARTAQLLIDGGFLTGVSIGFFASAPEMRAGIPTYTDVEVVELSLTPTPSSRLALIDLQRQIRSIAGDVAVVDEPEVADDVSAPEEVIEAPEVDTTVVVETNDAATVDTGVTQVMSLLGLI